MTDDRGIVWGARIQAEAQRLAARLIEKLPGDRSKLSPLDKTQFGTAVVEAVTQCMLRLGTFVTAGAQDHIGATIDQVTIGSKISIKVIPVDQGNLLELLAANARKSVTIAFVNHESYEIARESLVKAIHRDQMDWLDSNDSPSLFEEPGSEVCECEGPMVLVDSESCGTCGKPIAPTGEGTLVLEPKDPEQPVPQNDNILLREAELQLEAARLRGEAHVAVEGEAQAERAQAKRLSVELRLPVSADV